MHLLENLLKCEPVAYWKRSWKRPFWKCPAIQASIAAKAILGTFSVAGLTDRWHLHFPLKYRSFSMTFSNGTFLATLQKSLPKTNCWNDFYQKAFTAEIIFLSKIKELSSDKGIASGHFRISLMNCKTLRASYQEAPMHGKTYQTCSSELQTYGKVLILINLSMAEHIDATFVVEFLPDRTTIVSPWFQSQFEIDIFVFNSRTHIRILPRNHPFAESAEGIHGNEIIRVKCNISFLIPS